ncbi:hypothetical protein [Corynebacterium pygosceleis]|uniref:hypothetical protein n=1 Tax=Corynebacterium pygosceleis TaxID=2800406 RepID=UPI002004218B|nr:hypothetical protein [Corynebacterium pygosceleis]MCK7676398.1 hypothetical protein [Corynebacterium pygosceleis]
MPNPAENLHEIFKKWQHPSGTARTIRDDEDLEEHTRALKLLNDMDRLLQIMAFESKNTAYWRPWIIEWRKYAFAFPGGWQDTYTTKLSDTTLNQLLLFADAVSNYLPRIEEDQISELSNYLDKLEIKLRNHPSLPSRPLHEALAVITHIRCLIDDLTVVGAFDFQDAMGRLLLVLLNIEHNDKTGRWKNSAKGFIWDFFQSVAVEMTSSAALGRIPMLGP